MKDFIEQWEFLLVLAEILFLAAIVIFAFFKYYKKIVLFIDKWDKRDVIFEEWTKLLPEIHFNLKSLGKEVENIRKTLGLENDILVERKSPISLTDKGIEISEKLEAEAILDANYEELTSILRTKNPNNAYDIQELSMDIAHEFLEKNIDKENLEKAKKVAYEAGIPLESLYSIFGILLRDRILKERGFSHTDVDNHDPTNKN